ncbi:MAG: hypothetical protein ABI720_09070 [Actinomycetes bacterium]
MTHAAQALVYATLVDGYYSGSSARTQGKGRSRRSTHKSFASRFLP